MTRERGRAGLLLLGLILLPLASAGADPTDLFGDLNLGATAQGTGTAATGEQVGPYTIAGQGTVVQHAYFERELDAPPFYNFTSIETSIPTGFKRVNHGTCYGISMFTMRYYQWFVLPHVLDESARGRWRGSLPRAQAKAARRPLPNYALQVAKDMGLPDWVLAWPTGSADESRRRIAPFRLRTYLKANQALQKKVQAALTSEDNAEMAVRFDEDVAKEHAMRMFDNQMGLMRKGAQLYEWVSRRVQSWGDTDDAVFKRLFGKCSFDMMKKYLAEPKQGCFEVAIWGSAGLPPWGHSVIGYKITKFEAKKAGDDDTYEAYRIEIYDNNDPDNYYDAAFYYFPKEQRFAPSAKYAGLYDDDPPLVPKGEHFLRTTQMGPSTESVVTRLEENLMNRFSKRMERVEEEGHRGR